MRKYHNINEDYGHYVKRQYLKDRRFVMWFIIIVAFCVIVFIGGNLIEKLFNNAEWAYVVIGWIFIIVGIYIGYKIYKKLMIPKKRWTRRELMEVDEY